MKKLTRCLFAGILLTSLCACTETGEPEVPSVEEVLTLPDPLEGKLGEVLPENLTEDIKENISETLTEKLPSKLNEIYDSVYDEEKKTLTINLSKDPYPYISVQTFTDISIPEQQYLEEAYMSHFEFNYEGKITSKSDIHTYEIAGMKFTGIEYDYTDEGEELRRMILVRDNNGVMSSYTAVFHAAEADQIKAVLEGLVGLAS